MKKVLLGVATTVSLVILSLAAGQGHLIYHPRKYASYGLKTYYQESLSRFQHQFPLEFIQYECAPLGKQQSYLSKSRSPMTTSLWIFFGGNGQLALDWLDFLRYVREDPDFDSHAIILFEYPGYGESQGNLQEDVFLIESIQQAILHSNIEGKYDLRILGHSLGCGAGLSFASSSAAIVVSHLVLISPFASISNMASDLFLPKALSASALSNRLVNTLIWSGNKWDNLDAVTKLNGGKTPGKMVIVHGERDDIVPFSQGQRVFDKAREVFEHAEFVPIKEGDHNSIVNVAKRRIVQAMKTTAKL